MTTILGNLIDNAIGATKNLDKNRSINLLIKYNKGRIIIKMKNPYIGEIKYKNDTIVTSNADKDNHGIGLLNVKSTVEKYNGIMNIEHSANMFSVAVLIYV
jgi:sensor histidine kinase regulating citrate/malate metabolism